MLYELSGAELDAVAAGQGNGLGIGGLIGAGVRLLENANRVVSVDRNEVTISDFLNGNAVSLGVAANVLGTTVQELRSLA
jgi:hypothetical protein